MFHYKDFIVATQNGLTISTDAWLPLHNGHKLEALNRKLQMWHFDYSSSRWHSRTSWENKFMVGSNDLATNFQSSWWSEKNALLRLNFISRRPWNEWFACANNIIMKWNIPENSLFSSQQTNKKVNKCKTQNPRKPVCRLICWPHVFCKFSGNSIYRSNNDDKFFVWKTFWVKTIESFASKKRVGNVKYRNCASKLWLITTHIMVLFRIAQ